MAKRESERHRSVLYVRMSPKEKRELHVALVRMDLSMKEAIGLFAKSLIERSRRSWKEGQ